MVPSTFYRMLSPRRRRQLGLLLALMVAGAVAEMLTIGAALPFLALIAAPAEAGRFPTLAGWVERIGGDPVLAASLLLVVAAVVAAALRVTLSWYTHRFVTAVGHDLASGIFSRMLRQPYVAYVRRSSSEILSGIEKVQQVVNDLLMPGMQGLTAAFIAGAIMVLLCLVDPFALLVAAGIVTAVYAGLSLANRERLRLNSAVLSDAATARVKVVQEGLGGHSRRHPRSRPALVRGALRPCGRPLSPRSIAQRLHRRGAALRRRGRGHRRDRADRLAR